MAKPKIKCAFCHNEANSGEHIWDNWINEELPKTRYDAKKRIADLSPIQFVTVGLNEKLLAVCDKCNGGWMSALTAKVKKHFSEAIFNGAPVSIAPRDATILANFTFMKATVHDYFFYSNKPFFTGDIRKRLKMSLTIPSRARM